MNEIVNKVANSSLETIDIKTYLVSGTRSVIDIKDLLFQGLILKEADFRKYLKEQDWSQYQDHFVAVYCSVDAIIPNWAYMLLASNLYPFTHIVNFGDLEELEKTILAKKIQATDWTVFTDKKVVIKGCSDIPNPQFAFLEITSALRPYCASIMYGEPCSTVPIFKKSR
jgi:hypothetical protein